MKVLIYCPVFYPMIGGMETVTECTADLLVKLGHESIVITPIKYDKKDTFSFPVYRSPNLVQKIKLIIWADVVYSNGASLKLMPLVKLFFKPFVWKHAGYQASCIDGLGWVNGLEAPMNPWGSIKFHLKNSGFLFTIIGAIKLFIRRFTAKYIVDMNVAITKWVAMRQPFKKQVIIYNPSPLYNFVNASKGVKLDYDFIYMGRLVSEKGLKTLIYALEHIVARSEYKNSKLLIIGDGDKRLEFQNLVINLGLNNNITFVGKRKGQDLTDLIHSASIAVVPSEWEEPMGIVAIELMAAGRNIIVSENGGLRECVGEAGLIFPNGDHTALAACMLRLLNDKNLAETQRKIALDQVKKFDPIDKVNEYISLFNSIIVK